MCEGYAARTGMCGGDNPCVPTCLYPTQKQICGPGELLRDKNTCVKIDMCPCLKPDGTVAQVQYTVKNQKKNRTLEIIAVIILKVEQSGFIFV